MEWRWGKMEGRRRKDDDAEMMKMYFIMRDIR